MVWTSYSSPAIRCSRGTGTWRRRSGNSSSSARSSAPARVTRRMAARGDGAESAEASVVLVLDRAAGERRPLSHGFGLGQRDRIEAEHGQQPTVLGRIDAVGQLPIDELGSGVLVALAQRGEDDSL